MDDQEAPEEYIDAVAMVQSVLAALEPSAMCTGFVALAEWIEEDGSPSLSMVHSPMSPWHLKGMLDHARQHHELPVMIVGQEFEGEWEEEE